MLGTARNNERPHLIFDFDGTIANTFPLVIEVVEQWSVTDTKLTVELIEELRGMPAQQALKRVGIPLRKVPALLTRGRRELMDKLKGAEPFPGIIEVIKELAKDNDLYVMSSNSDENINHLLKTYGITGCFKAVYGNVSIFGKTKTLKKILKTQSLSKSKSVYIGDETRDIEAAHKLKIKAIAVTWGFNNKKILSQFQPEYKISKPQTLLKIAQEL